MMIDAQLQLSAGQAVTATAISTNAIDLGQVRDPGASDDLYMVFTVDQTCTAAGAATVTFQAISGSGVGGGTVNAGTTVLAQTDAIPIANLAAGRRPIVLRLPRAQLNAQPIGQRYLGAQYTIGTGPLTAGQFTCNLVVDPQDLAKLYAGAFTAL